jgi:hypothetical protein
MGRREGRMAEIGKVSSRGALGVFGGGLKAAWRSSGRVSGREKRGGAQWLPGGRGGSRRHLSQTF